MWADGSVDKTDIVLLQVDIAAFKLHTPHVKEQGVSDGVLRRILEYAWYVAFHGQVRQPRTCGDIGTHIPQVMRHPIHCVERGRGRRHTGAQVAHLQCVVVGAIHFQILQAGCTLLQEGLVTACDAERVARGSETFRAPLQLQQIQSKF